MRLVKDAKANLHAKFYSLSIAQSLKKKIVDFFKYLLNICNCNPKMKTRNFKNVDLTKARQYLGTSIPRRRS